MAGEQRNSWWKFKKSDDESDSSSATKKSANTDSSKNHIRELRDQFLHTKNGNDNYIFGAELEKCLEVTSVTISVPQKKGSSSTVEYGAIPTVVARCGNFLKTNGFNVEGVFRVGGSSKRVKKLQEIFCSPPSYGKDLDWVGYTVHDAASLLRRFLNSMPEPVIPLDMYEEFRTPLQKREKLLTYLTFRNMPGKMTPVVGAPLNKGLKNEAETISSEMSKEEKTDKAEAVKEVKSATEAKSKDVKRPVEKIDKSMIQAPLESQTQSGSIAEAKEDKENKTESELLEDKSRAEELEKKKRRRRIKRYKRLQEAIDGASEEYTKLVLKLPGPRLRLLLYILDLLEAFSVHSGENKMSAANLSAVFQPSILSHPKHDMCPEQYILSQKVVEFLVEYSYKLLPEVTSKAFGQSSKSQKKSKTGEAEPTESPKTEPVKRSETETSKKSEKLTSDSH